MANTKSAQKAIRVAEKRRSYNKPVRSALKTAITKAEKLISAKEADDAKEAVVKAVSQLDKAVIKGVIHRNNADRHKSRLMKKLNAVS